MRIIKYKLFFHLFYQNNEFKENVKHSYCPRPRVSYQKPNLNIFIIPVVIAMVKSSVWTPCQNCTLFIMRTKTIFTSQTSVNVISDYITYNIAARPLEFAGGAMGIRVFCGTLNSNGMITIFAFPRVSRSPARHHDNNNNNNRIIL